MRADFKELRAKYRLFRMEHLRVREEREQLIQANQTVEAQVALLSEKLERWERDVRALRH